MATPEQRLGALSAWLKGFGSGFGVRPAVSEQSLAKLKYLTANGRPFMKGTPQLKQAVVRYLKVDLRAVTTGGANIRTDAAMTTVASACKAHILLRFTAQGNDVHLDALRASTLREKAHRGQPSLIGIATRALFNELSTAEWTVARR